MISFVCPVCGERLEDCETLYRCRNNHCFDKSKFKYVNLLLSNQSSSKRHGDDRLMIRSRRDFLEKGYYSFLLCELEKIFEKYAPENAEILDCGCGECYYSQNLLDNNPALSFTGIDISKDALEYAFKRGVKYPLAVASAFSLPFEAGSFDAVLNVFAPLAPEETARVLKDSGIFICVVPLERHLFSLKKAIYDKPYLNEKPFEALEGFELIDKREIKKNIHIQGNTDIENLFRMTPYYYKTSRNDQQKAHGINDLTTEASFCILIFRKV